MTNVQILSKKEKEKLKKEKEKVRYRSANLYPTVYGDIAANQ